MLKGLKIRMITPPARLDNPPCSARPIATPLEASSAAIDDYLTPKLVAMVIIKSPYKAAFTNEDTNWVTPVSASCKVSYQGKFALPVIPGKKLIKKSLDTFFLQGFSYFTKYIC